MKIALLDAADTIARSTREKSVQMQSLASRKCVFEAYEWDLCVYQAKFTPICCKQKENTLVSLVVEVSITPKQFLQ